MTPIQLADLIFTGFQDDCAHSIDPPYATGNANDETWGCCFETERVGPSLFVKHTSGKCFVVTVQETGHDP